MLDELFKLKQYIQTIYRIAHMHDENPYILGHLQAALDAADRAYEMKYDEEN